MPRGRPKKVKKLNSEQEALKFIAENPAIIEALLKIAQAKTSPIEDSDTENIIKPRYEQNVVKTKPNRVYKSPIKQIAFDDPKAGITEGKWDKKRFPKKAKFEATERRPPAQKFLVTCKCGRSYETTQKIYGDEFGYTCENCIKQRQT